jgi:hypothetical protein
MIKEIIAALLPLWLYLQKQFPICLLGIIIFAA